MPDLELPRDLSTFLDAQRHLEYDPVKCEAGAVTLLPRCELRIREFGAQTYGTPHEAHDPHRGEAGVYKVPGVNLVATCTGDYEPEGLLVWFPGELSYGVWDASHDYILVFGCDIQWSDIAAAPARYINAQWAFDDLDRAPATFIIPWIKNPFSGS